MTKLNFCQGAIRDKHLLAITQFHNSNKLPKNIPITTPFTFPILEDKFVLAKDKNNWWNPLGGHLEKDETWRKSLVREAFEEGGVLITTIRLFGYMKVVVKINKSSKLYPPVSLMPFTFSKVKKYENNWQPMETSERKILTSKQASGLLKLRDDNDQMLEIFHYLLKFIA